MPSQANEERAREFLGSLDTTFTKQKERELAQLLDEIDSLKAERDGLLEQLKPFRERYGAKCSICDQLRPLSDLHFMGGKLVCKSLCVSHHRRHAGIARIAA